MKRMMLCATLGLLLLIPAGDTEVMALQAEHESSFYYAYIANPTPSNYQLLRVDPLNPGATFSAQTLPTPAGHVLEVAKPSPNGGLLALVWGGQGSRIVQIVDALNGDLITSVPGKNYANGLPIREQIVWSANSQFLAFNVEHLNSRFVETNIYNTQLDQLFYVGYDPETRPPQRLAWSPDSSLLAIGVTHCVDAHCESDVDFLSRTEFRKATFAVADVAYIDGNACEMGWSPDSQFFSYLAVCDELSAVHVHDLFVWNRRLEAVQSVTQLTSPRPIESLQYFDSRTDYSWVDTQTIMLGYFTVEFAMRTGYLPDTFETGTQLVDVTTLASTRLAADAAYEISPNPVFSTVAYRAETIALANEGDKAFTVALADAEVRIVTLTDQNLDVQLSAPPGCKLSWSPDGQLLAYVRTPLSTDAIANCVPETLAFVYPRLNQITEFSPGVSGDIDLVGWIGSNEQAVSEIDSRFGDPLPNVFPGAG